MTATGSRRRRNGRWTESGRSEIFSEPRVEGLPMPTSVYSFDVEAVLAGARAPQVRNVDVEGAQVSIRVPFPSTADWRDR